MAKKKTKIRFQICKWTRPMGEKFLGYVMASHQPEAKKKAWEKWPELKPTKTYPNGRALISCSCMTW